MCVCMCVYLSVSVHAHICIGVFLFVCLFVCLRQSYDVVQADLELLIFLPLAPKCWNYRPVPQPVFSLAGVKPRALYTQGKGSTKSQNPSPKYTILIFLKYYFCQYYLMKAFIYFLNLFVCVCVPESVCMCDSLGVEVGEQLQESAISLFHSVEPRQSDLSPAQPSCLLKCSSC